MGDEEFIKYCALHSLTDRALFNGKQIARLLHLAGDPYKNADRWDESPSSWVSADLSEECRLAAAILNERTTHV